MPKKKRHNPRSLMPFAVLGGAVVGGMVLYREISGRMSPVWLRAASLT